MTARVAIQPAAPPSIPAPAPESQFAQESRPSLESQSRVMASAAWHSLLWLVIANSAGVLLATLLLLPGLNRLLGEWTYGRWIPFHINLQLYGWCSLPLVGFLFRVYGADREPAARWCRPVLWVWSSALGVSAYSWLEGRLSGKLFLDWTGYSRVLFPLALAALWCLLAFSYVRHWNSPESASWAVKSAKLAGLALLLAVPVLLFAASSPNLYPPVNPDSGGPTGASQLESVIVILAILLSLPFGLTRRNGGPNWRFAVPWLVLGAEIILCLSLGRGDVSHRRPVQYISLGSLLIWLPLVPMYYAGFNWHPNTRRWRIAFLVWWTLLVPTGWSLFLPGILDRFKFTDGLVGHSLLAMAGFATSLLIFILVQLLGDDGWIFNATWSFFAWQGAVFAYVVLMFIAGWQEGSYPAFAFMPAASREFIYTLRLLLGIVMLAASAEWLSAATGLNREPLLPDPGEWRERSA